MDLLHKYINEAQDTNKVKRCAAFKKLNSLVSTNKDSLDPETSFSIIRQCLKGFEDSSERCREESVRITATLLTTQGPSILDWVLPAIVTRIGVSPITEESEEVRLLLLQLASQCLSSFPHEIGPRNYIDFFQVLLENCFQDPYPDLKKEACKVTMQLCAVEPQQVKMISVPLAKSLKNSCLLHKHSAVRSEAVRAFGVLLRHGASEILAPGKEEAESRTTVSQLFVLCNDHGEAVRLATVDVLSCALLDVKNRLEQHPRYLPHLLFLSTDSFSAVREAAVGVLTNIGKLYLLDNEDNRIDMENRRVSLKDIAWYADDDYPPMEFPPSLTERYPILTSRPPLGIRYAVAEAARNYLPKVLADVSAIDWVIPYSTNNRKTVALRILWTTIFHCEKSVVQSAERILCGLYSALRDDSTDVQEEAKLCVEILGKFLTPEQYLPFVMVKSSSTSHDEDTPVIERTRTKTVSVSSAEVGDFTRSAIPTLFSTAAVTTKCSILIALRYLVEGSKRLLTGVTTMQIVQATTSSDLLENDCEELLLSLLNLLSVVFRVFAERGFIATVQHPLPLEVQTDPKQRTIDSIFLYALLRLRGSNYRKVSSKASSCIEELSLLVTGSSDAIYTLHAERLLLRYGQTMPVEAFSELLSHSKDAKGLGALLRSIFLARLSEVNFSIRVTEELRYFSVLERVLWTRGADFSEEDLEILLRLVVLPLSGFQPGNVAHLFRKIGINCLCALMSDSYRSTMESVMYADESAVCTKVLSLWASASDSDDGEMRLMCMSALPDFCKLQMTAGSANELVQSVQLRFDDSNDSIRLRTSSGLLLVLQNSETMSTNVISEINTQVVPLTKKVLVYLDDDDDTVGLRPVLLKVLQALGDVSPNIVVDLIRSALPNHHDPAYGQAALDYIIAHH